MASLRVRRRLLVWLVLGGILLLAAWQSLSSEPRLRPSPPDLMSVPSPVPSSAPPVFQRAQDQPSGEVATGTGGKLRPLLREQFGRSPGNWPNNRQSTAWLADGAYHVFVRQPGQFVAIGAPLILPLRNVVVSAAFRKTGGPPGGGYGLIVRDEGIGLRDGMDQRGRYYVLEVGDQGEFGVWRRELDRWIDIVPWTPTGAVRPGNEINELVGMAIDRRLGLMVNGTLVANMEDTTLGSGTVGIFVGGDLNEVAVEQFSVEVPSYD